VHGPGGEKQVSLEGFAFDPFFTPDGKKLLYRILKGASLLEPSELRITDLESGITEPLLPDVSLTGKPSGPYDVSRDGRHAAALGMDQTGERSLWIAPLDRRRSPPRAIFTSKEEIGAPQFGTGKEIYFIRTEGSRRFLSVILDDGTGLRNVSDQPILNFRGVSPDNRWAVALTQTKDNELGIEGRGIIAYSLPGAAALN
jgi:hypothetical protein